MGFDNECILNIQSLAGEYFCPVCRLLVYPTEAVQSQCTHLYCKPCLTYVVGTTRACPYDGYLVTEADSKPLTESNKALAETIGKIGVHCLYHRSGCTWQGPLSDCTSHCTGCAFGNSPVVCNRCGVQIVHSQVQEHAQNCSQTEAGQETAPAGNQNKSGNQVGAPTTVQAHISQTTASATPAALDPNVHTQVVHGAGLTPEQLYQQQQQYYQQYPVYDPYQQQYQQQLYPYQQHAAQQYHQQPAHAPGQPQPPPQAQPQPIAQPQPLGQPQLQANPPQQLHPAVPHSQIPPQSIPQAHGNPPPQPQLYPQPQPQPQSYLGQTQTQAYPLPQQVLQMPQSQIQPPQPQIHRQQPIHSVAQPQPYPQPQFQLHASQSNQPPHAQHQSVHAVSGHQSYQQPQPQQQIQLIAHPQQHSMVMHPQSVPNQLPQHAPAQVQSQFPQQPGQMRPPVQNQQQPIIHSAQQVHPHAHQPGYPVPSQPAMHPNQQHVQQQYFPFPGQPTAPVQNQLHQQGPVFHNHQQPMQSHLHQQAPSSANPQTHPTAAFSHGTQPFQSQNYVGRPMFPNPSGQSRPFAMQPGAHKQSMLLNNLTRTTNQSQTMSEKQLSNSQIGRDNVMTEGGGEVKPSSGIGMKNDANYVNTSSSIDDPVESKIVKYENDRTPVIVEDVNVTSQAGSGINSESNVSDKNNHIVQHMVKEEAIEGALEPSAAGKSLGNVGEYLKDQVQQDQQSFKENEGQGEATILEGGRELCTDTLDNSRNVLPTSGEDKNTNGFPVNTLPQVQVPPVSGQPSYPDQLVHYGHYAPSMLHAGPPGPPHEQGHPNQLRPQGSGYMGQGQPINHPDHMQSFVRDPSGGPFLPPPFDVHGGMMSRPPPHGPEEMFMSQRHGYLDGRQPHLQHSGSQTGIRDDRFRTPYSMEPSRRMIDRGEFEDDLKQFPRPSHLDADPKLGGYFSSSRPLDKLPHGSHYDDGLKLDPRNILHPNDARDRVRPSSFHDDNMGRSAFSRGHPDFFRPVPQYGRLHMDGSPIRDYPGMPPRRFNVHSDPLGSIHESRFPPPHLHRDDPFLPSHLRLGELHEPGNFPPRFGEPGFRSSYTSQDTGFYKGTMESYDNPRKRKTPSMGWCRICKVDSETMEGLDLHSQTREHQDAAMSMVLKIKQQNAKKKKIISNDHSAAEDASKPNSASIENRQNRH